MSSNLLIQVNFLDGRYHGEIGRGKAEWPPAPGRLFQAMVAGGALGSTLEQPAAEALRWLECKQPPIICSPETKLQATVTAYLPNNNLDKVSRIKELAGDPRGYVQTKTGWVQARNLTLGKKTSRANLLVSDTPLAYVWQDLEESDHLQHVVKLAEKIYQLGRGIDPAWAYPRVLDDEQLAEFLENFSGQICPPGSGATKHLKYPTRGTLDSLLARYQDTLEKFDTVLTTKRKKQPAYKNPLPGKFTLLKETEQHHFDIRQLDSGSFKAYPAAQAYTLVDEILREAAKKLGAYLQDKTDTIERVLVGCKDSGNKDKSRRVRVVPIPTVRRDGDRDIRRILVDLPRNCGLRLDDLRWAFSNLELSSGAVLRQAEDATLAMDNYVCESRSWQTETPIAMPKAQRRRIDPAALDSRDNLKDGSEVQAEQTAAMRALRSSLRHAGIGARIVQCTVQREPFAKHGTRAEEFAEGKDIRFSKHALWHASITFAEEVQGPLVLGDGRYRGLGVFSKQYKP